jgi:hypothetical protein
MTRKGSQVRVLYGPPGTTATPLFELGERPRSGSETYPQVISSILAEHLAPGEISCVVAPGLHGLTKSLESFIVDLKLATL